MTRSWTPFVSTNRSVDVSTVTAKHRAAYAESTVVEPTERPLHSRRELFFVGVAVA